MELNLALESNAIDENTRAIIQLKKLPTNNIPIEINKETHSGDTFNVRLIRCNKTDPLEDVENCAFDGLGPDYDPHYRLTIPRIGDKTVMYIELVPNILNFYVTPFRSFLTSGDDLSTGLLNSELFQVSSLPIGLFKG